MENLDSRLLRNQKEEQSASRELKEKKRGEAGEESGNEADTTGEQQSLRQRVKAARQALNIKEQAKKKIEEKVAAPVGILKTKLLNMIPGYGPYVAFKNAVLMRKGKFTLVDIIIMAFSNLNACFIVLIALTLIVLIITWTTSATGILKLIMDLGWNGIELLIGIFKS